MPVYAAVVDWPPLSLVHAIACLNARRNFSTKYPKQIKTRLEFLAAQEFWFSARRKCRAVNAGWVTQRHRRSAMPLATHKAHNSYSMLKTRSQLLQVFNKTVFLQCFAQVFELGIYGFEITTEQWRLCKVKTTQQVMVSSPSQCAHVSMPKHTGRSYTRAYMHLA